MVRLVWTWIRDEQDKKATSPGEGRNPVFSKGSGCVSAGVQKGPHREQVTSEPEKKVLETREIGEEEEKTIPGCEGLLLSRCRESILFETLKGPAFSHSGLASLPCPLLTSPFARPGKSLFLSVLSFLLDLL